jgi:hypothetical protein
MFKYFLYTWNHKIAFLKCEKRILGKNSLRGYLHDLDKLILYALFIFIKSEKIKKMISKIHHKRSKHHEKGNCEKDFEQMIIDWECARDTKPDKPLNAYDTLYKYHKKREKQILPLLIKYNLNHSNTI